MNWSVLTSDSFLNRYSGNLREHETIAAYFQIKKIAKNSGKRLQWHPLKSEFLKNRGRYRKMVLGHYRGIS